MQEDKNVALATITYMSPSFLSGMARTLDVFSTLDEPVRVRIAIRDIDVTQFQRENLARAWQRAFRYLADATSQVGEGLGFPQVDSDMDSPD